jgi:hypothetical protein
MGIREKGYIMTNRRRSMEEILHIIELTGEFGMIAGVYNVTIHIDGDKLTVYPGKQDPTWEGWRNVRCPHIEITRDGEVVSIHDDIIGYESGKPWREKLTDGGLLISFVPTNQYNWSISFFKDDAKIIKEYILHLADMWAAYNNKETNA